MPDYRNQECTIMTSEVLYELGIGKVIDKLDFSDVDEYDPEALKEYIKERLDDNSNYTSDITVNGDAYICVSDAVYELDTDDLIDAIESSGFTVMDSTDLDEPTRGVEPQNLFEKLCNQFDLPRAATSKQDLIKHINSKL